MLGNTTGFAALHVRTANGIEQTGLTVVDVTHNGDHRRPGLKHVIVFFCFFAFEVNVECFEQLAVFVFR